MQTLKVALLLFVITILGSSCTSNCNSNSAPEQLTADSKSWVPYSSVPWLIFTHDVTPDTVRITQYTEALEPTFRGDECPEGKMTVLRARLVSKLFSDTLSFAVSPGAAGDEVSVENKAFYVLYVPSRQWIASSKDSVSYHPSLTLGNRTFSNAIVSSCRACNTGLRELVFAQDLGLVAYKVNDDYWIRK